MKKYLFTLLFLTTTLIASAEKGEKYVSASIGASFGTQSIKTDFSRINAYSTNEAKELSLGASSEFGYFVTNNFKIGCAIGGSFFKESSLMNNYINEIEIDNQNTDTKSFALSIIPNVAYYVRITDKFSYTPEVGCNFSFGKVYGDEESSNFKGWTAYLKFISFEFRITEKFALGVNYGGLGYTSQKLDSQIVLTSQSHTKQFTFNAKSGDLHAKFYLGNNKK